MEEEQAAAFSSPHGEQISRWPGCSISARVPGSRSGEAWTSRWNVERARPRGPVVRRTRRRLRAAL